ncbi:1-acyl-sn-glycerol-3-phosphate acyltransferase [Acholeplasma sp. OttesenSCG-928-E16]|nr:1-acyl-sn-glycerol-3-phosphate acyltransferase [Acholeplasma sp. OttesenSCG-928-E16]
MNKKRSKFEAFLHDIIKFLILIVFSLIFRTKYIYEDKTNKKRKITGGTILVSNHNAWDDSLIILNAFFSRRLRFLVKKELAGKKGRSATLMRIFGMIFIDRKSLDMDAINASLEVLENNEVLTIFPEGTRVKGEEMGGFKSGVSLLSLKSKVPIVPIYVKPYEKWYKRRVLVVGSKITTHLSDNMCINLQNTEQLTDEITRRIEELKKLA